MKILFNNNIFKKNDMITTISSGKYLKPLHIILRFLGFRKDVGMTILNEPVKVGEGWEYEVSPERVVYKWLNIKLKTINL
jgi:hypothetical protein